MYGEFASWRCVRVVHTCHVHLGLCWPLHVLGPELLNSSSWCSPVFWLVARILLLPAALLNSDSCICCRWPSSLPPPLDEGVLGFPPAPEPGVPCWGRGPIRLHTHTHTLSLLVEPLVLEKSGLENLLHI